MAGEVLASLVVFLVALPLCMGIAIASGAPASAGLITGVIGGLVAGSLAGCPLQVSGPAAGLSVITASIVANHGLDGLAVICLLAGLIQIAAGLARLGMWFRAVPPAVIHGMLAGIGVLIFSSQFHVMVDDVPRGDGLANLISIPQAIYKGLVPAEPTAHHLAAVVGTLTILTLVAWSWLAPRRLRAIPAPLVAVIAGSAVAALGGFPVKYVSMPADLMASLSMLSPDALVRKLDAAALGAALVVAVIASAETLLTAAAVDRMQHGPRTDHDRELVAQGVGNALCGLLGGLPMTGVIVRSKTNVDAGARTRASAILHGLWIFAFVMFFPGLIQRVPVACLAAVLVYTGFKLVDPAHARALAHHGRAELMIYAGTLIGIVATDLLKGVLFGLALAAARLLYTFCALEIRVDGNDHGHVRVRLEGAATFLGLPRLAAALESIRPGMPVVLDTRGLRYCDHACQELLELWELQHLRTGAELLHEGRRPALRQAARTPA